MNTVRPYKKFILRHSLALSLLLLGSGILIVGLWVLRDLRQSSEDVREVYAESVRGLDLIGELQYATQEARRQLMYALATRDDSQRALYVAQSRAAEDQVGQLLRDYVGAVSNSAAGIKVTFQLSKDWNAYLDTRHQVLELILQNQLQKAEALDRNENFFLFNRVRDDLQQLKQIYKERAGRQLVNSATSMRKSFVKMLLILSVTLGAAVLTIVVVQRQMLKAIRNKTEQLKDSIAFSQAIITNAGDGIVVFDADQKIMIWNTMMEQLSGVAAPQALGKVAAEIWPWGNEDEIKRHLHKALHGDVVVSPDLCAAFHEGKVLWREAVYSPQVDSRGLIVGAIAMVRDVTERKQAADELTAAAQKLEQRNRELQEFAFVASHDLQEPLRKIQAFGDRLRLKYAAALDETGLDYLQRMQNAAARMQTLISDLLAFSRVTTKAQPFQRVNLAVVAQEVLSDLEVNLEQTSGIVALQPLPTIDADPTQMRQLFQNLIGNALKFHRPGQAPRVEISAQPSTEQENWYEFRVTDNGIGFEEKYADRIFTIFQRLHGRTEYEGTGIGLAVCRKIVERHGGVITAQSKPESGATFIFKLPVAQT